MSRTIRSKRRGYRKGGVGKFRDRTPYNKGGPGKLRRVEDDLPASNLSGGRGASTRGMVVKGAEKKRKPKY
jgi:hypothetical protein